MSSHLELIFSISSVFGLSPLVFADGQARVSSKLVVYCVFFSGTILYFSFIDHLVRPHNFSVTFHRNLFHIVKIFHESQSIVYFCTHFFKSQRLCNIWQSLGSIDSALRSIGIIHDGSKHGSLQRRLYLLLLFVKVVELCRPFIPLKVRFGVFVILCNILGCGQYTAFGEELYSRLHLIVHSLRQTKEHPNQTGRSERLTTLCKVHHQLCNAIEEFSSCYGFQMATILLLQFLTLTMTTFTFIFYKHTIFESGAYLAIYMAITLAFTNFMAINCSANISEKSKEFNMILYDIMIKDKSEEFLNNERLQLHVSMKREVILTVCGLFSLDYTMVHSMIAAVTTYLVVLYQFV